MIDFFSKQIWCRPMKTKSEDEVTRAFKDILRDSQPRNVYTNQCTEYYNVHFQKLMGKYNINHLSCKSRTYYKNSKETSIQIFHNEWYLQMNRYLIGYHAQNNQKYRTIGMKPCDVTKKNEQPSLRQSYTYIKVATGA